MNSVARQKTVELLREVEDALDTALCDKQAWDALVDIEKALKTILLECDGAGEGSELMSRAGLR